MGNMRWTEVVFADFLTSPEKDSTLYNITKGMVSPCMLYKFRWTWMFVALQASLKICHLSFGWARDARPSGKPVYLPVHLEICAY